MSKLSICSVFLFIFVLLFCEYIKIRLGIVGLKVFKIGKCVILFDVVFLWVVNFDCLWVLKFECFWIVNLEGFSRFVEVFVFDFFKV